MPGRAGPPASSRAETEVCIALRRHLMQHARSPAVPGLVVLGVHGQLPEIAGIHEVALDAARG